MGCIPVFTDQLSHGKQQLFKANLLTFKVWETKSHISLPKEIGEDDNNFKVDFKNIIYLKCAYILQVLRTHYINLTLVSVYLIKSIQYF